MSQNKQPNTSNVISYAESVRRLKETWNNEPVTFVGGIRLNHNGSNVLNYNVCYND
jgi:hypothetical protein